MPDDYLTDRDIDLILVALDSAATSVQGGHVVLGKPGIDPLAAEYATAERKVDRLRRRLQEASRA